MKRFVPHAGQAGLTLIETMVSITLGLLVVGAMSYMYVGSKGAYGGNESLARMQEAGRFALDAIARDIRRSGALGCGSLASIAPNQPISITVASPLTLTVNPATAIQGFSPAIYAPNTLAPSGTGLPSTAPTYWNGDVLQMQIATGVPVRVTATPDTTLGTIPVSDNTLPNSTAPNFNAGDYALLANCTAATVLQITGTPAATTSATLSFAQPGGVPAISASSPAVFAPTSYPTLQHFDQVTYYVGKVPNSSPVQTALYRYSAINGAEELVENIEDMDVVYGVDGTASNTATQFEHANNVADWTKVVSVRVSVIAVGDQLGAAAPGQKVLFRGQDPNPTPTLSAAAPDTRLRLVFSGSTTLRDRINVQ